MVVDAMVDNERYVDADEHAYVDFVRRKSASQILLYCYDLTTWLFVGWPYDGGKNELVSKAPSTTFSPSTGPDGVRAPRATGTQRPRDREKECSPIK